MGKLEHTSGAKLILVRHGESCWNNANLFTGWVDVPLSSKGIHEALEVGKKIADLPIDIIYASSLVRAQMTAFLAMSEHHSKKVPVVQHQREADLAKWSKIYSEKTEASCIPMFCHWELNERMYGELQGLNKAETIEKFGAEQVKIWRRSYDVAPPKGESLEMTAARTIPFFKEKILPQLIKGKNVLVSAHGNSLRAICMVLEKMDKEQILNFEIPTGQVLIYQYGDGIFTKEVK